MDEGRDDVAELVRVTVDAAGLQRLLAEFPDDLADAARRALQVRSASRGPADVTVAMWPLERPEHDPE